MKKLSIKSQKNLFGFLTVLTFLITGFFEYFPEIVNIKFAGICSAISCLVFEYFWVKALDKKKLPEKDFAPNLSSEELSENDEAMRTIFELQTLIKKETGRGIKFVFEIDDAGMINFNVPRGFSFELRNKDKNTATKKFQGRDFVEVVNSLLDYFKEGGEGKITADENNFQFRAQFHYNKAWVVNNSHVGSYAYTDTFDE